MRLIGKLSVLLLLLAFLSFPGRPLAEDEQAGQQGEIWNLGILRSGKTYPTEVIAENISVKNF